MTICLVTSFFSIIDKLLLFINFLEGSNKLLWRDDSSDTLRCDSSLPISPLLMFDTLNFVFDLTPSEIQTGFGDLQTLRFKFQARKTKINKTGVQADNTMSSSVRKSPHLRAFGCWFESDTQLLRTFKIF